MRGREFTMKDAYSFDRDVASAHQSYQKMFAAYERIFTRMGLRFRAVAADSGAIGGSLSHEFQVIADSGEDAIAYCPQGEYAANLELAEALPLLDQRAPARERLEKTATPHCTRCAAVAELLGIGLTQTVKSIVVAVSRPTGRDSALEPTTDLALLLVRGDHELNEVKTGKLPGFENGWRLANESEVVQAFGSPPGYLGPVFSGSTPSRVRVIADRTVARMSDFVAGANAEGFHFTGVNWGRDLPEPDLVADLRNVVAGDPSPDGKGELAIQRGIEVGHVFYLGTQVFRGAQCGFLGRGRATRACSRWVATASASRACWGRRSSKTTTSAASSGPKPSRPLRSSFAR
jgi:prolyl-tRNA synthetase